MVNHGKSGMFSLSFYYIDAAAAKAQDIIAVQVQGARPWQL